MAMNPYGGSDLDQKTFTIPLSGAVRLWGPEVDALASREFQRLAGLKQLGTAYVTFRGAVHTRLEHSLGALHEAERLVEAVNRNPLSSRLIDDYERQLIRMAALLHDVTHIPFGHTLEDEFRLLRRHDRNDERKNRLLYDSELGRGLRRRLGDLWFEDFKTVTESAADDPLQGSWPFAADIIGNTVCADMLDYVPRDLAACGMPAAIGDRFLDFFTISSATAPAPEDRDRMVLNLDKRGMPRPDVESEVLKLLTYRYELVERVYFHHAKNSASVMLARAVQSAGLANGPDEPDDHFDWLSDESLLLSARDVSVARALGIRPARRSAAERTVANELADRVLNRDLYKIAYLGVHDDLADRVADVHSAFGRPDARVDLEDQLARRARLRPGQVLVHVPPPPMLLKLAEVRVLTHHGHIITLDEWDAMHSGRARALVDAHRRLWRVAVYVDPRADDRAKALVRAAAEDAIGAPSRYTKPVRAGAYLREVFDQNAAAEGWTTDDWDDVKDLAALGDPDELDAVLALLRTAVKGAREARRAPDRGRRRR